MNPQQVENTIVEARNKLSPIINEFRELSGKEVNWYKQVCVSAGALDVAYQKLREINKSQTKTK